MFTKADCTFEQLHHFEGYGAKRLSKNFRRRTGKCACRLLKKLKETGCGKPLMAKKENVDVVDELVSS